MFLSLLLGCGSVAHAAGSGEDAQRQVLNFCERFARQAPKILSDAPGARYVAESAVVDLRPVDRIVTFIGNLFQPPDSRFIRTWNCRFRVVLDGQKTCAGRVSLPVAEHKAFADYTQWPEMMFVEDNQLTDAGYITPKYYELDCAEDA